MENYSGYGNAKRQRLNNYAGPQGTKTFLSSHHFIKGNFTTEAPVYKIARISMITTNTEQITDSGITFTEHTRCRYMTDDDKRIDALNNFRLGYYYEEIRNPAFAREFKPGTISNNLRHALGLQADDIPEYINRMSCMEQFCGYPPGYLKLALIPQFVERVPIKYGPNGVILDDPNLRKLRKPPLVDNARIYRYEGLNTISYDGEEAGQFVNFQKYCAKLEEKVQKEHDAVEVPRQQAAIKENNKKHAEQIRAEKAAKRDERRKRSVQFLTNSYANLSLY